VDAIGWLATLTWLGGLATAQAAFSCVRFVVVPAEKPGGDEFPVTIHVPSASKPMMSIEFDPVGESCWAAAPATDSNANASESREG
jgi:hypothetical protein